MNVDDPDCAARIRHPFELIMAGLFSVRLDIPGAAFNRAIKAGDIVHKELLAVHKEENGISTERKVSHHRPTVPDASRSK